MKFILLLFSFLSPIFAYSQVDSAKSNYGNLKVIRVKDVDKNAKVENKKYSRTSERIEKCKPCLVKYYNLEKKLYREVEQYSDCAIGKFIEYYPNGKIKIIGYYKVNNTGNWDELWNRDFCSIRQGKWIYYYQNGKIEKEENYEDNKLK